MLPEAEIAFLDEAFQGWTAILNTLHTILDDLYTVCNMKTLDRPNISGAVAETVREMIVEGQLPADSRINEVHLAAELGVSRTPLREALMGLVAEGALSLRPRLGFHVAPLTMAELEEIYPIRALLDPEALRLAGLPDLGGLRELKRINEAIRKARRPREALALDDRFHRRLLAGCPNRVLIALIEQFNRRTRRYELALMREKTNVSTSADDHDLVLRKLARRDLRGACAALRRNMESGRKPIAAWLRSREASERKAS
jgi:DNA-binding GntR family transcriptional regulator